MDLCCSSWRMNRDSKSKIESRWGTTEISPLLSRKEVTQEIIFPNYKELKMSLRINNNVEAMNAHRNLAQNDKMLAKSIERLSSGQKINRGADGPASLVISEGMRSQIASLQQAADNNESAISMVQTAEGALNEVSKLLVDMRQRAVAAANVGINDSNMANASQKEIENALDAIDRISENTQFGSKHLLNGSGQAGVEVDAEKAAEAALAVAEAAQTNEDENA